MTRWRTVRSLRALSKRTLADRLWAAEVNADESMEMSAEAWATIADLVAMLDGAKPRDEKMLTDLRTHKEHVIACQRGSCEHEYKAMRRRRPGEPEA